MSINTKTGGISAPEVSFKFSGRAKKLQIKVEWWSALIDASRVGRTSIFGHHLKPTRSKGTGEKALEVPC